MPVHYHWAYIAEHDPTARSCADCGQPTALRLVHLVTDIPQNRLVATDASFMVHRRDVGPICSSCYENVRRAAPPCPCSAPAPTTYHFGYTAKPLPFEVACRSCGDPARFRLVELRTDTDQTTYTGELAAESFTVTEVVHGPICALCYVENFTDRTRRRSRRPQSAAPSS